MHVKDPVVHVRVRWNIWKQEKTQHALTGGRIISLLIAVMVIFHFSVARPKLRHFWITIQFSIFLIDFFMFVITLLITRLRIPVSPQGYYMSDARVSGHLLDASLPFQCNELPMATMQSRRQLSDRKCNNHF